LVEAADGGCFGGVLREWYELCGDQTTLRNDDEGVRDADGGDVAPIFGTSTLTVNEKVNLEFSF
jgi:hypothetical protein